ncbi:MAG: GatB/YqeY domain-containing protein [Bdellovibrionales bacterium]|nr:GatB/YqeY domain-containing protein [Bdellovibrionales bacterium]
MSLKLKITEDTKEAMKAKDMAKVSTLRFLTAAVKNKEIEVRPNTITEDDILNVIKKSVKQRQDSIEMYEKGGRLDLVEQEKLELKIIESYLPQQLGASEVEAIVKKIIASTGATSIKDMGAVMKAVQAETKGAADNKVVSELVRKALQA